MPNHMQYNTIKVYMSGDMHYPKILITRDNIETSYQVCSEYDLKRIQLLFDAHKGHISIDLENSAIELTKEKFIWEKK